MQVLSFAVTKYLEFYREKWSEFNGKRENKWINPQYHLSAAVQRLLFVYSVSQNGNAEKWLNKSNKIERESDRICKKLMHFTWTQC